MNDSSTRSATLDAPAAATRVRSGAHHVMQVIPLSSKQANDWDRYVRGHPAGTLFHTTAWRNAVQGAFSHEAVYLTAARPGGQNGAGRGCGGRIVGVLPMFLVKSRLAGRTLVSVPYGVAGGILADDQDAVDELSTAATCVARQRSCQTIDLRSETAAVPAWPTVDRYVGFRRALPQRRCEVLSWLPRKARAAARNARDKYHLAASFGDEHLEAVWRLYSLSMRRLGSLAYPKLFFKRLLAETPGRHWVTIVQWRGRAVAGLITFLFRDRVMPYFIGTTGEAKRCSASNFIYLAVMERGVEHGYRVFDFGRSRRDNVGSYNFKRFHGFEPRPLEYQCYAAPGHTARNLSPGNPRIRVLRRLWRHLPLAVTRMVGARLARHIPG